MRHLRSDTSRLQPVGNHRNQPFIQAAEINPALPVGARMDCNHGLRACDESEGLRLVEIAAGYMQSPVVARSNTLETVAVKYIPGNGSGNI